MQVPTLLNTNVQNQTFSGITYHIQGELVPVLTIELTPTTSVYFEHHVLLWKSPSIAIGLKKMGNVLKRMFSGLQIFITEATGMGQISFSRDGSGHIIPIHLAQGQGIHVREHQFIAATQHVDYTFERVSGIANILVGNTGFFIDQFFGNTGEGVLWVYGYGNVFEINLGPGEQIDVEPSGWLYKDTTVKMETVAQGISTGLFSSMNLFMNRFTGPGRLAIQSMYYFPPAVSQS